MDAWLRLGTGRQAFGEKMKSARFSIVVPTLNRSSTLKSTLSTCVAQEDENLEILVSDNCSDDDTQDVVASFGDARIRYIRPSSRLGMSEHWEFACNEVRDGYVTVLGDDDGFLPQGVIKARSLIEKHGAASLTWKKIEYHWPDHIVRGYANWLYIPLSFGLDWVQTEDAVREALDFRRPYNWLPCIYNSFVETSLLRRYSAKNDGIFFAGSSPDIYSSFAIASQLEKFLFSHEPLSVNGASSKSNGTRHTQGEAGDPIVAEFKRSNRFKFEEGIPDSRVIEFAVLDAFYKVSKRHSCFSLEWVNSRRVIESAVYSAKIGVRDEKASDDWMASIRQYASALEAEEILVQIEKDTRRPDEAGKLPGIGLQADQKAIIYDASMINVNDVAECANFCHQLYQLRDKKRGLFSKMLNGRSPLSSLAIVAKAGCNPVQIHLGCGTNKLDGYINVDYPQDNHAVMQVKPDVACDILSIDLPENSIEEVRLHHVFEHFNRTVAIGLVIRWHRWLSKRGQLVIETPDFEASARAFLAATTLSEKCRAIRHLEGDQADAWAYHVGQWFPERFAATFEALGFACVGLTRELSCHEPPLHNVVVRGEKHESRSIQAQIDAATELLKSFMVAEPELPTWQVWCRQLKSFLAYEDAPHFGIYHPRALDTDAQVHRNDEPPRKGLIGLLRSLRRSGSS